MILRRVSSAPSSPGPLVLGNRVDDWVLMIWNLTFLTIYQRSDDKLILRSVKINHSYLIIWDYVSFVEGGWSLLIQKEEAAGPRSIRWQRTAAVRVSEPSVIRQLWLVRVNRAQIVLDLSMSVQQAGSSQLLV